MDSTRSSAVSSEETSLGALEASDGLSAVPAPEQPIADRTSPSDPARATAAPTDDTRAL
jgi:hypothetical protein